MKISNAQKQVVEFNRAARQEIPTAPTSSTCAICCLRAKLIQEELEDYKDSCFVSDLEGIADAIGDMLYVVLGAAVAHGINIEPIFEEIHRSNMSKFGDHSWREDGKLVKGPNYSPAYLLPILVRQEAGLDVKPETPKTSMELLAKVSWDKLEDDVVDRIHALRDITKNAEPTPFDDQIANEAILPCIELLGQFVCAVQIEQ